MQKVLIGKVKAMDAQKRATAAQGTPSVAREWICKDSKNSLPPQQKRIYNFLLSAHSPQSVAEIATAIHQCDPRAHIRNLRKRGIAVADIWCKSSEGIRYKRYFIRKEVSNEE